MNAAKGRLRTILHYGLFGPNEKLLGASCICRKETLYDYEKHLFDIEVWPLEQVGQKVCISTILDGLQKFSFEPKSTACYTCTRPCRVRGDFMMIDYNHHVKGVVDRVREYFDGLCLDCLDRTKPKFEDTDKDYWLHASLGECDWCRGCRVKHKQPTWYFSFMGRQDERDRMIKKKRREKREGSRFFLGYDSDDD